MNLLKFNDEVTFNVLVDNQFGEGVLCRSMCVTETNLLVVILVKADCGAVEILDEAIKPDPEDAV